MPLTKLESVRVIAGTPAVEGREESTYCVTPPPGEDEGSVDPPGTPGEDDPIITPPGDSGGGVTDDRIYLYDADGNGRTPSFAPAPAGYVCETGLFFLPDPTFTGGMIPVFETRCYLTE